VAEFASNIYAAPATMGTISVAWQPLCSRAEFYLQPSPPPPPPLPVPQQPPAAFRFPPCSSVSCSLAANSTLPSFPRPSPPPGPAARYRLARSDLPPSQLIGRRTETGSDRHRHESRMHRRVKEKGRKGEKEEDVGFYRERERLTIND